MTAGELSLFLGIERRGDSSCLPALERGRGGKQGNKETVARGSNRAGLGTKGHGSCLCSVCVSVLLVPHLELLARRPLPDFLTRTSTRCGLLSCLKAELAYILRFLFKGLRKQLCGCDVLSTIFTLQELAGCLFFLYVSLNKYVLDYCFAY